jgi:uncharacterized protein YjbJ (UPF0337 family)
MKDAQGTDCAFRDASGIRREYRTYHLIIKEIAMNKDQVKGAAKDIGGKIQEEAGKLVGSKEQQVKGLLNQAEGKAQQHIGNLEEVVKKASNA